jgi:TatD DNase family protein
MMNSRNSCNVKVIDSHNHIHFRAFRHDMDQVIERATSSGVLSMLAVGIDPKDCRKALSVAKAHQGICVALGIHPQNGSAYRSEDVYALKDLVYDSPVVAVGETGFDLYRTPESANDQRSLFIAHIELARELSLPLVIHDRMAHDETCEVLDDLNAWNLGGVFHCFSGDEKLARFVTRKGFFISIPGVVTFKNAKELREVVKHTPMEFLLAETDAPYLAPEPYRGKRNEPQFVIRIIEEMAEIKGLSCEEVARTTTENFERLFLRAQKTINKERAEMS